MNEFIKKFQYEPDTLTHFPFLHHFMSDDEMTSENYFVGPKTHNRVCSHTEAVFILLNQIVDAVS